MTTTFIGLSIDTLAERNGKARDGVVAVSESPNGASNFVSIPWPLPRELQKKVNQWRRFPEKPTAKSVGEAIFDYVLPVSVQAVLNGAIEGAKGSSRTLIGISSTERAVHTLPLEIAHDGKKFLHDGNRIVFRQINDGKKVLPKDGAIQRVLVVLADPLSCEYEEWGQHTFAGKMKAILDDWSVDHYILENTTPEKLQSHLYSTRDSDTISKGLLASLQKGNDIFTAFRDSINHADALEKERGTAMLFARRPGSEDAERSLLKSLFSLTQIEKSQFIFSLPAFRMGVTPKDWESNKKDWFSIPPDTFHYRGLTTARDDVRSIQGLIALLGKLLSSDDITQKISLVTDGELNTVLTKSDSSHLFIVGSRSHDQADSALRKYSRDFSFKYDKDEWHILDKRTDAKYSRPNPSLMNESTRTQVDDYALIEKIVLGKKVIFFIAGMRDTSTLAAGQYLIDERRWIVTEFGVGGFQILLRVVSGTATIKDVVLARKPNLLK